VLSVAKVGIKEESKREEGGKEKQPADRLIYSMNVP
jgi:hypothetical protein